MGARGYPAEFRRRVVELVNPGRKVAEVAVALGISDQMICTWRRQDRIDRGLEPGLSSAERSELAAARKRIRELETELAVHRRATALASKLDYAVLEGVAGCSSCGTTTVLAGWLVFAGVLGPCTGIPRAQGGAGDKESHVGGHTLLRRRPRRWSPG